MPILKTLTLSGLCGALAVGAFLSLSSPALAQEEDETEAEETVTAAQCRGNWFDSDATWTCSWTSISANSDNNCVISVSCRVECTALNRCTWRDNTVTVSLDDVLRLRNCTGTLTVGSC